MQKEREGKFERVIQAELRLGGGKGDTWGAAVCCNVLAFECIRLSVCV